MIKKIDHISIAVSDLEGEIRRYRDILGFKFLGREVVPEQKVEVAFFDIGGVFIELTTPTGEDSPVAKFLAKKGSGIHHIAYEVDDIVNQITHFESNGINMIDREPRQGAHQAQIAFAHPKSFSGVLVEIKEKKF